MSKIGEENVIMPVKRFIPHAEFTTAKIKSRSKVDQKNTLAKIIVNKQNEDDKNLICSDTRNSPPSPQLGLDSERNHLYSNKGEIIKTESEEKIQASESIQEMHEKLSLGSKVNDAVCEL